MAVSFFSIPWESSVPWRLAIRVACGLRCPTIHTYVPEANLHYSVALSHTGYSLVLVTTFLGRKSY